MTFYIWNTYKVLFCAAFFEVFILAFLGPAAEANSPDEMQKNYHSYAEKAKNGDAPFILSSNETTNIVSATATAFLDDIAFSLFERVMSKPQKWCEFVTLHLNVKSCIYYRKSGAQEIVFYLGQKRYMTWDEAEPLQMNFNLESTGEVFRLGLYAATGPYGSKNYDLQLTAIGVNGGVYLEFNLSTEPGLLSGLLKIYLSTLGRKKIGFSVVGQKPNGKPRFVKGQRGGVERNLVRYLFAIQAYLQNAGIENAKERYLDSMQTWYDLTQKYPLQLYELAWPEYKDIRGCPR